MVGVYTIIEPYLDLTQKEQAIKRRRFYHELLKYTCAIENSFNLMRQQQEEGCRQQEESSRDREDLYDKYGLNPDKANNRLFYTNCNKSLVFDALKITLDYCKLVLKYVNPDCNDWSNIGRTRSRTRVLNRVRMWYLVFLAFIIHVPEK